MNPIIIRTGMGSIMIPEWGEAVIMVIVVGLYIYGCWRVMTP